MVYNRGTCPSTQGWFLPNGSWTLFQISLLLIASDHTSRFHNRILVWDFCILKQDGIDENIVLLYDEWKYHEILTFLFTLHLFLSKIFFYKQIFLFIYFIYLHIFFYFSSLHWFISIKPILLSYFIGQTGVYKKKSCPYDKSNVEIK